MSTSTITVQLRDANNNDLTSGGDNVALATTLGSLGSVTDNGDGTYTATLTSAVTPGTATVTGTVNVESISDNATVDFTVVASNTHWFYDDMTPQTFMMYTTQPSGSNVSSVGCTVSLDAYGLIGARR